MLPEKYKTANVKDLFPAFRNVPILNNFPNIFIIST